jgi:rhodanese-related sulfurtransferase
MRPEKLWALLLALMLAVCLVVVAGCATAEKPAEQSADQPAAQPAAVDPSTALIEAASDYLRGDPGSSISAKDLYDSEQAEEPTYEVVDIRVPEHYTRGHINGAISIPFEAIYTDENIAKLDSRKITVIADYNGHAASAVNMFYNMLGYDALALRFGMSAWTTDTAVYGLESFPTGEAAGYPTVTESSTVSGSYALPKIEASYDTTHAAIIGQMEKYVGSGVPLTITAKEAYKTIVKAQNPDYQIVDVRTPEEFEKGHIAGAINILWTEIADTEKLATLDPSRKVLVYCQTGHTGADATLFLNLIGYTAVDLEYGMCGWASSPEAPEGTCYDSSAVRSYPVVSQ